jgi:hypothetical protein
MGSLLSKRKGSIQQETSTPVTPADECYFTPTGGISPLESKVESKTKDLGKKATLLLIIKQRIDELNSEIHWYTRVEIKNKKIRLLVKLKEKFELNPDKNLDVILDEMAADDVLRPNLHLLWQGRTAKTLQKLKDTTANSQDRIQYIDLEIAKLKEELPKRLFFFAERRKKALAFRFAALEQFKKCLIDNNYNSEEALKIFQANPTLYPILHKEKKLLSQIKKINIDDSIQQENSLPANDARDVGELVKIIGKRINELEDKAKSSFYQCSEIVANEIILLKTLADELPKSKSFQKAMDVLFGNPVYAANIHLLFEGKTGKILRENKYLAITKEELCHLVDTRIAQIKNQRYVPSRFFSSPIQERIEALELLKLAIRDPNQESNLVFLKHTRKTLEIYDNDLFQEVRDVKSKQPRLAKFNPS